ncbi:MAG: metallophosphoesterase family protein [Lachnospiraceae bacterium]|nr:metallophosphoesterase family protein [Lachnospiraceae bacterium]MDE7203811.1 metallophosphoesterase family protein [Lachnospiraceae bacterium]
MSVSSRLERAFKNAPILPLTYRSRYVLMSDCHRGVGTSSDNFLKNQHLYSAALKYYYQRGFTYIELGDGDELWENRSMKTILEVHDDVFGMFAQLHRENRIYLIYGNHDVIKKKKSLSLPFPFYEGIILCPANMPQRALYLTHGHQASLLNSTFWRVACFLVRYVWSPLENLGVLDPTSAAKNYHVKNKCETRLNDWASENKHILITGHTHRPVMPEEPAYYYNTGSCVHPRCITCIEIGQGHMTLVKWSMSARADSTLYVARERISGLVPLFSDNVHQDRQMDRAMQIANW